MPRTLDPVFVQAHQRANPATCDIVEISAPDATRILRRANDQFFTATPAGPRVSESPAASSAADANGALILAPTNTQIASFAVENTVLPFGAVVDPSTIIKGVGWTMPMTFGRIALKKFTARIHRTAILPTIDLELRIYRPKIQRYFYRNPITGQFEERRGVTFLDVLPEPVVVRYASIAWGGTGSAYADWIFDLSQVRPAIAPGPLIDDPIVDDPDALNPHYIFQINPVNPPKGGVLEWMVDQTTSIDVATYGRFQEIAWTRPAKQNSDPLAWSVAKQNYCPCFRLEIETYAPTSTIVYEVNVGKRPAADSTGRIVFERGVPVGGAASLELSTAGSGGPWTAVKHGDEVAAKQQLYHLRLTMTAPSGNRHTPRVRALGLDFRVVRDVSAEVALDPVVHEIEVPYLGGTIGDGSALVVRHGRRDYRDIGSEIAITYPVSKLELDHYVGSRHAKLTRDRWLHYDRVAVTNREPGEGAERFGLLSPLKALKKKIPARIETINTIHAVTSATTSEIVVTPNLQGAAGSGDYAGRGYYMRVRASSQVGMPPGYIQTIDNNTNLNTLNFSTALPGTLVAGDQIEVHSGTFEQPSLEWVNADPADVWWDLLTLHLLVPAERIGLAGVGQASRSGLPPRVTDRAPGDATTQAKLKVTLRIQDPQDGDKLVDQVSFLLGGCTVAIGGQIAFRQIYPLRNAAGDITVPTSTPETFFDARDYTGLAAPMGLEQRINTLACDYGIDTTLASDATRPTQTVVFADGDAIAYLAEQDVEGLGNAAIPKEIARWCFNSADGGRLLAEQLARQVVNYASTGLRVWSWTAVDARPELMIGDSVWIVTDQYTDYDPTRKLQIRGWWAFQLILVHVAGGGRQFRGLLPGLGAASPIRGGAGTLSPPNIPIAPAAPTATIAPDLAGRLRPSERLTFNGAIGAGDAGPLSWRYKIDDGAYTAPSVAPLPQQVTITRDVFYPTEITLEVSQGDGQTDTAQYTVGPSTPSNDTLTGRKRRAEPNDDGDHDVRSSTNDGLTVSQTVNESGGKRVNRLFAKPLPSDSDNADSVTDGLSRRTGSTSFLDSVGRPHTLYRSVGGHSIDADALATPIGGDAENWLRNGGGQEGLTGGAALGWTYGSGATLVQTISDAKVGDRCLEITNSSSQHSYSGQQFGANDGDVLELSGWLKGIGLSAGHVALNVDHDSSGSFTPLAKDGQNAIDLNASQPDIGIAAGVTDWNFVRSVFRVNGSGLISVYAQLGYSAPCTGTARFDGLKLKRLNRATQEGGARGYGGFTTFTGGLVNTATESGGKNVNRLFAKPLSSDADALGAVPDDLTYRKVAGVNASNQITPSSSSGRNRCSAWNTTSQTIAHNTLTALALNTEFFDVGGLHDNATNNSRLTIPSGGNDGPILMEAQVRWDNSSATGSVYLAFRKNGTEILRSVQQPALSDATFGTGPAQTLTALDSDPAVGDYYEVVVKHSKGSNRDVVAGGAIFSLTHLW